MKPAIRKSGARKSATASRAVALLVATRKGAFILKSDAPRRAWKTTGPFFLGQIVHHMVCDPRDRRTVLAAVSTGHLGPTMMRSTDRGRTWKEVAQPPAFAKAREGETGRSVNHTFWLTPGHASEPGVWFAGTAPQGLFRSTDGGDTWAPYSSINDDADYRRWMGSEKDGTPDLPKLHSIIVDPRDRNHMLFGMSGGGVHESFDGGRNWEVVIDGMEVVEGFNFDPKAPMFHDPHCLRFCPSNPDRIYQQNHCGIYRRDGRSPWVRIGRSMPTAIGDVGFPLVVHPRNDDVAWVFPMDATRVWPRVSPGGKPAAYVTKNGGKTWQRQDKGLPRAQGWFTVKRQAMCGDAADPVGLYFGTTGGEVWASRNEGAEWKCIVRHLPEIYAIEAMPSS